MIIPLFALQAVSRKEARWDLKTPVSDSDWQSMASCGKQQFL